MITQIIRLPEIKQNKLWLTNLWFDCILLILPSFLGLAFLLPYYILGPNSVVYIYFFQTFFLGGPHFFLSFYYIYYKKKDIRLAVVGCGIPT